MKRVLLVVVALCCASSALAQAGAAPAATPQPAAPVISVDVPKKVEAYLRDLFALGPTVAFKVGAAAATPVPGFFQLPIEVTSQGQTETLVVFVTADGKYLLRGDLHDTGASLFSANRSRIKTEGYPAKGPADAPVTIVEYGDFQCPTCREMRAVIAQTLAKFPGVRYVFKDLPLTQIHPWAMTAALGARCALQQNETAYWKVHDAFFDNQESITTSNAWNKTLEIATAAGLDVPAFRICMTSAEAKKPVEDSVNEARTLSVANTPTTFINGRRMVGADRNLLEQYINYELARARAGAPPAPRQ
jgi:protein-disulfide isomerase